MHIYIDKRKIICQEARDIIKKEDVFTARIFYEPSYKYPNKYQIIKYFTILEYVFSPRSEEDVKCLYIKALIVKSEKDNQKREISYLTNQVKKIELRKLSDAETIKYKLLYE